jgi:6-pyruvoyltetrahydropterin/6-carboxytetrahydropterin synthase
MYTLRVCNDFVGQHYLTVPNSGPENEWHSHHFEIEVLLEGEELNQNGYLVDIVEVEEVLDQIIDRYEDATLNDLPEFQGRNPSIEHFSRIVCTSLQNRLSLDTVTKMTVRIWEDEEAWASYST